MTIIDQIRDEKLQYYINKKAAKISALSSKIFHKYEYLTDEDVLPSNQQQIIEQTKFTYSPLGKAFEKQIKIIKDQGERQIKAIQNQRQIKAIKKYGYDIEDTSFISKQKEIFNELVDEKIEKIIDLNKKVNKNDLIYKFKGSTPDLSFGKFNNAFDIIDNIRNGKLNLADVKYNH